MLKKISVIVLSLILIISFAFSVSAAAPKEVWSPYVKVDDVTATANDTVLVNLEVTGNVHGIMAITISVVYDQNVLDYVDYYNGIFRQHYVVKKQGYIAIVDCENKSIKGDGTIITLEFKVKENAHGGTYPIKIAHVRPNEKGENLKDCFANWRGDEINPIVTNGSITIPITQQNCRHNFSSWSEKAKPTCAQEGADHRNCSVCGKNEIRTTEKTDHIYEEEWTIDKSATEDSKGSMSRHCANCNKKTDNIYFPFSLVSEKNFKNTQGDKVTVAEKLIAESYKETEIKVPEQEIPQNEPQEDPVETPATDEIPDANTIVNDIKTEEKIQDGIAGKIYNYLFGKDGKGGIINAIIKAFKQFIDKLF